MEKILITKISILLEATKNAASRTRYVFLTSIVSSIIIIFSLFNADLSWHRFINAKDRENFALEHNFILPGGDDKFMTQKFADMYLQRRTIILPILNIRCAVDDFSFIAGVGMVILVTWFFFTVRREHHTIQKVYSTFTDIKRKAKLRETRQV